MVSVMEVASVGLSWRRSGSGEWPEVEVRMRICIRVCCDGLEKKESTQIGLEGNNYIL